MDLAQNKTRRATQRENEILRELRRSGGSSRIQQLATRLDVSEETIRRNLKSLASDGLVRRVHGGAHLPDVRSEASFQQRVDENPAAKRRIAEKVAEIIEDGDSLFLDIGSTTSYIAQALQRRRELFVVTNSVSVAHTLAARNDNRVFMAGGELRDHDGGAFGVEAIEFVRRFQVDYAVLSAAALNAASCCSICRKPNSHARSWHGPEPVSSRPTAPNSTTAHRFRSASQLWWTSWSPTANRRKNWARPSRNGPSRS
jgi:DeoR family glycerol-3-phosphate regulon repressor